MWCAIPRILEPETPCFKGVRFRVEMVILGCAFQRA
jgi:hypothetical protein